MSKVKFLLVAYANTHGVNDLIREVERQTLPQVGSHIFLYDDWYKVSWTGDSVLDPTALPEVFVDVTPDAIPYFLEQDNENWKLRPA